MKTILITGGNGFTGRYVAKTFRNNGFQVVCQAFNNSGPDDLACDLSDRAAVNEMISKVKPDGIIHLAALSFVGHADQSAFYNVNVFGILNIFDALAQTGLQPEKIVVASSANIYGNPRVEMIDETTPPNPVNHYAASKLAMEFMVKQWFPLLPIIITRPFNYTGVGQDKKFLVPKIVNHFKEKQRKIELGNLDVARDFSDVTDIAKAYLQLYESDCHSEVVNLCSGKVYELKEIIDYMNMIADYKIDVTVNKAFVRENEIKVLKGSNDKLKTMVNYQPETTLLYTLKQMYSA